VIPDVPCFHSPEAVVEGHDLAPARNDPGRAHVLNRILTAWANKHRDRVRVVDYASWVCPGGKFVDTKSGKKVREDGVHFTAAGASMFWHWLMPQLAPDLDHP
jgi:lysophospholipase L1-like esterase